MCFLTILSFALVCLFSRTTLASPSEPAAAPSATVTGHVWVDANCNGIKEVSEGNAAHFGIVQFINTGNDRVLNTGDKGLLLHTDANGNWKATNVRVFHLIDEKPLVYAVAVGKGSAAALGYKPSPEGPDTILKGPTFASDTFQVHDGQTLNVGEIGICPLPKVFLPSVRK
jgi:hypothetical protein